MTAPSPLVGAYLADLDRALAGADPADRLEIVDVLSGFNPATAGPSAVVRLSASGDDTVVSVNADGQGTDFVDLVTLQNVAFTETLLSQMLANGNLLMG